jgi:alpha-L-rhamnosidase
LRYTALAQKIKKAINDKYFDREKGIYASGVQTELSMALYWNIVPQADKIKVAQNLARRVVADSMHLDVGVLGAKAILNALSDNGQAGIAYQLATQNTYPSWGWWIVNGATTLYENWDINATRDISQNHMMFGEIGAWFFKGLGGIKTDENAPGFKTVRLEPNFVPGLDSFSASHDGPFGKIISEWKRSANGIIYQIEVPANSSAAIKFPAGTSKVLLDGKEINPLPIYKAAAGHYRFEIL